MTKKTIFLIFSSLLLSGCFAESMTLVQSGIGASQGKALQSAVSPSISYGIKHATGKFPVEHIILREKQKQEKKVLDMEKRVVVKTKKSFNNTKEKVIPVKDNVKSKFNKFNDNLFQVKTFTLNNFKHKPRFSYKVR